MSGMPEWMVREPRAEVELLTDRPHAARVYDVLLGGKTNYPPDREAARKVVASVPGAVASARANRAFMHRAAHHLAAEAGVGQFLDIGTGIPTSPNLHEVVQRVRPEARVVYVDNDPIVLAHSRALHTSHPAGRTAYIEADAGRPDAVMASPELIETLDLSRPVAVTLLLLLHWLPADRDPHAVVRCLMDAVPSGSYLAVTHVTGDFDPPGISRLEGDLKDAGAGVTARSREQILRFFDGLELLDPGLEVPQRWRPDPLEVGAAPGGTEVPVYAGVARKP